MLPSPARIILQAVQAFLLVGLRPATDRLFIHEENVGGLPVTVAFGHQQQRMVALPLVTIEFLVFVTSRSFQEVWLAQHCASFFRKSVQRDNYILSAPAPYLGVPGIEVTAGFVASGLMASSRPWRAQAVRSPVATAGPRPRQEYLA